MHNGVFIIRRYLKVANRYLKVNKPLFLYQNLSFFQKHIEINIIHRCFDDEYR